MIYTGPFALVIVGAARTWPAPAGQVLSPFVVVTRTMDVYSGDGIVSGDAVNVGPPEAPVARRFRLVDERSGALVREVWSDATTGAWAFDYIRRDLKYTVLGYDHTGYYNGWIRTGVSADPI